MAPNINLMKKLDAMADGEGPEADNARRILEKLLNENNMTRSELYGFEKQEFGFRYNDSFERRLLQQVILSSVPDDTMLYKYSSKQRTIFVRCTSTVKQIIDNKFTMYRKDMDKHMEAAFTAYIYANNIFGAARKQRDRELTEEELELMKRVSAMVSGIAPVQVHIALEAME
jgi:hypothetical protein